jgi:2-keto-3-deoxy-L-rhamnonate aldolase RhmA
MVVVPTCEAQWISRCLDAGVQAVVVPHVNNVEEAQLCVAAAKYPPLVSSIPVLQHLQLCDCDRNLV